ncbi:MAG TPA: hydroxymethylglutaryl-CoA synthase [Xanthomonadales bacterium]|nr:hydroxymethylglutaryl-CoA synthase [Xanthomonadales bacterium]
MPNTPIGIDALAFAGPAHYLDMSDLAIARGVDPGKYLHGLGQRQMAIATPCEDTVTMAAEAGAEALTAFDIDPDQIGTLIVGTETGVDHSKPVAVYVHELLGLSRNCRTFETKHACYGAMAGLTSSTDWIAAGRARGRKALVIASDIARYGLQTPGEPTQGAGAVAMVVSDRPRLAEIDRHRIGDYTRQVMDFWRPLYSKYAFADGHYSIQCYLDALEGAWHDAGGEPARADRPASLGSTTLAACLYHVPFVKMARKAHHKLLEIEQADADPIDEAERHARFEASYQAKVAPWLELNATVGNIYTGSLFLALIDLLSRAEAALAGREISLFSYGSGCGATFCLARIAEAAADHAARLDPRPRLAQRQRLDIDGYERLMRACEDGDRAESLDPASYGLHGRGLYFVGTRDHVRHYIRA